MFDPNEIDPLRFCKLAQTWEVDASLSQFPRLVPEFTHGQLFCRISGRTDQHSGCVLRVEIRGEVGLTCQRCLSGLTHEVAIACDVYLAANEAELERRSSEVESGADVILRSAKMSLVELIEEEVLLGLPLAPMHPPGVCVMPAVIN